MSVKKPLVITNGQVEQLQAGDRLDLSRTVGKTNNTGATVNKATPVYVTGGNINLAQADAQSTTRVAGLLSEETADGDPCEVQTDGLFAATTAEWDAITGDVGGLTEGADYWLDADTAGQLTATAPTADGDFVAPVGQALSATEMEIQIGPPIKL
jgi:hypothetical protein